MKTHLLIFLIVLVASCTDCDKPKCKLNRGDRVIVSNKYEGVVIHNGCAYEFSDELTVEYVTPTGKQRDYINCKLLTKFP